MRTPNRKWINKLIDHLHHHAKRYSQSKFPDLDYPDPCGCLALFALEVEGKAHRPHGFVAGRSILKDKIGLKDDDSIKLTNSEWPIRDYYPTFRQPTVNEAIQILQFLQEGHPIRRAFALLRLTNRKQPYAD